MLWIFFFEVKIKTLSSYLGKVQIQNIYDCNCTCNGVHTRARVVRARLLSLAPHSQNRKITTFNLFLTLNSLFELLIHGSTARTLSI